MKLENIYVMKKIGNHDLINDSELSNYLKKESTSRDIIKKFEIFKRIVEKQQKDFYKILNKKCFYSY